MDGCAEFAETRSFLDGPDGETTLPSTESNFLELYQAQVRRQPDATALVSDEEVLSYQEMDQRANRLAGYLRLQGIGREHLVGVCLPRNSWLIVALIGVLKAGGAYIVLDPALPVARLRYIVEDAQLALVLTQRDLLEQLSPLARSVSFAALDRDLDGFQAEERVPPTAIDQCQAAYVIYTSGSTGRPKGVIVEHRQLRQYIEAIIARLELVEGIRTALLQSLTADFGITILYPTFCLGGVLHLVSQQCASDPQELGRYIQAQAIDVLKITPSHWAALVGTPVERALLPKQALIFGGESLRWSLVRAISDVEPALALFNHYGPTEATVGCLAWQIRLDRQDQRSALVPLGTPLGEQRVSILNENMEPLAPGLLGEISIGGPGVTRGYVGRADGTAERFVPDPFAIHAGERLYRTGDQGRLRADGLIEYLGRMDDQVKIRGYRVELGEVTALLTEQEGVREAVVVAREDQHHDLQLVAYVVPGEGVDLSIEAMRSWMQERVPDYLVPTFFRLLQRLPLLPNGKIDRRALPEPGFELRDWAAPRTALEEHLVTLWQQVLGGARPGIQDHFFVSGGHSLLAMRLLARIRREIAIELPLQTLFTYSTIAELAGQIEGMQEKKRQGQIAEPVPLLTAQARPERIPLSQGQQFLWFFYQLEPVSPFYNIPLAFHLRNSLSIEALQASLGAMIQRHEILRTVFVSSEMGEPEQVVLARSPVPLAVTDLRELSAREREISLARLLPKEARQPFVLEAGPLLRAHLIRLDWDEHVFLLTFHHIIFDGWSQQLFLDELAAFYQHYVRTSALETRFSGAIQGLPEPTLQYADYTLWQRQWLREKQIQRQLVYWRNQLKGAPTVLNLPGDHPRPPVQTFRGGVERFVLSSAVNAGLKAIGQREGATLFMTLLAAFSVLLSRYSGQRELLIGSPVANRRTVELEPLIGFFVNMLVLRCDLEGYPDFNMLLQRLRATTLEAYANQDLPFEYLVQELGGERSTNMNPLFQVALVLQREQTSVRTLGNVEVTRLENHSATAKFDLLLDVSEIDEELSCKLEYSIDLFEQATIARMVQNFQVLLAGIIANPQRPVSELPLLHESERQQIAAWSTIVVDYPRELCIHELFAEQARLQPDAVALVYGALQWSYGELDRAATRLASTLRTLGIGPEVMVGTCFERSPEQVMVILAILKAGGCYVPIEPHYPEDRLTYMFENSAMSLLLAERIFEARLSLLPISVRYLDTLWGNDEASEPLVLPNLTHPDNLAHVLYTSGSTGQPKGVSVTHRNVARLVKKNIYARLDRDEVLVQYNPIAFDASTLEMWCSLLSGARLVIAPPGVLSLGELADLFQRYGVTTAWITAGLFHQMVDHHVDALLSLRQVMAGGDVLSVAHVKKLLARADGCTLINGYGPTENTVFTCCYPMKSPEDVGATVSIGRVIANTQIHVLDEEMQPVPVGVYGELYVGGDGLSRGYLRHPVLTAERYLPHPFSAVPGERLYRTGDIVRFVADGTLEFLGRADFQVKVRGFRIELGEIEAALQEHVDVRDAVAVVCEGPSGDKRVVAYILMGAEKRLEESEMRRWLRARLPEYLVPNRLVVLEQFPLSPNGKVDRQALPPPDDEQRQEQIPQAARTPAEEILQNIWCQTLNVRQIGIHDNFFERGGHSLLAMSIIARIRLQLGSDISLRTFLEHPTIAHLALQVEQANARGEEDERMAMPALVRQKRPERVLLSLAQQRLWFLCQLDPENPFYNIALALRLRGPLAKSALEAALGEIVRRHEVLRTRIVQGEGEPLQVIEPPSAFSLPLAQLEGLPTSAREHEIVKRARAERSLSFDLAGSLLMRAQLLCLAPEEHVLFLTFHHLIFDGWSQQQFLHELAILYLAFARGEPSPLAEPPVQYVDYALWQRRWLREEVLAPQLSYWQELLRDVPTVLELPMDRPRPPIQTFRGATVRGAFPRDLIGTFQQMGQREGYTPFMLFLAAFGTLLFRLSGQTQILLGTASANRRLVELEALLGFCVNTVLMRIDLRAAPGFRELLRRVRETVFQASAHQDVPFEKLVEALAPQRSLSHNPLFQVGFGFWSQKSERRDWGTVKMEPLPLETTTVKQDLMLDVVETPDGALLMQWDYNSDLFERATIERWQTAFVALVQAACADPDQPIAHLSLLLPEQEAELWRQGQGERIALAEQHGMHELVAWQADRQPEVEALRFGERSWSYGQLQERVNLLARQLQAAGVGTDVLVGIYLERSLEQIVAILGVLSAGGAYVPLDVSYPSERLAYICRDSHIVLLLTQEGLRERVPVRDVPVVVLDADGRARDLMIASEQPEMPLPSIHEEQLAYVIYTSGSTGRPKGVMIAHRGILSLVKAQERVFGSQKGKRILQFASLSFDASVWEIVMALGQGGTLVLAEQVQLMPGLPLQTVLHEQRITTVTLSPSVLAALPEGEYPDLQQIIVAGEACGAEIVSRWGAGRAFFNAYGPTETTVCASVARCASENRGDSEGGRPPIGSAIANLELYVVDKEGELVAPGVAGELYLGGIALARGYLGRASQTAESFVPHPWSQTTGARLYRTKDLVRWRADGQLEYLGRLDQQVKIRGFRIELGEIEAVLRQQEEVRECVVVVREDEPGEKRLVGYIVARDGRQISLSVLRERSREMLPEYMVPGVLVQMEALPISANAKIDFRQLPVPNLAGEANTEREYIEPTAPLERDIAAAWCEVLHLEKVSIHDGFFDLGGHSLLLTHLQRRLSEKLRRPIALVDLFQQTTVSAQATFFSQKQETQSTFKGAVARASARQHATRRRQT
jgi:amino acid adenylation domain-containing protein